MPGFFMNVLDSSLDFLTEKVKPMYFKYLTAAFGSALISSIYGVVDMSMVGQYQGPEGTAAVIGVVILAAVTWLAVIFFDRELLLLFGAEDFAVFQEVPFPLQKELFLLALRHTLQHN